jgi:hypothetical protein
LKTLNTRLFSAFAIVSTFAIVVGLTGCRADCAGLVGLWRTEYNGETLAFELRADQSLTTTASGEITGGSWQCLSTGTALLKDKKTPPVRAVLVDAGTLKLPVSKTTPGLPEITLTRVLR